MTTILTERQKLLKHMESKNKHIFKLEKISVTAKPRQLSADWTLELAEDIQYIIEEDDAND